MPWQRTKLGKKKLYKLANLDTGVLVLLCLISPTFLSTTKIIQTANKEPVFVSCSPTGSHPVLPARSPLHHWADTQRGHQQPSACTLTTNLDLPLNPMRVMFERREGATVAVEKPTQARGKTWKLSPGGNQNRATTGAARGGIILSCPRVSGPPRGPPEPL